MSREPRTLHPARLPTTIILVPCQPSRISSPSPHHHSHAYHPCVGMLPESLPLHPQHPSNRVPPRTTSTAPPPQLQRRISSPRQGVSYISSSDKPTDTNCKDQPQRRLREWPRVPTRGPTASSTSPRPLPSFTRRQPLLQQACRHRSCLRGLHPGRRRARRARRRGHHGHLLHLRRRRRRHHFLHALRLEYVIRG
jgi:hypothetical protein